MKDRELLEKVVEEIVETSHALHEYDGYEDKMSEDYGKGWRHAIDTFVTNLVGRKEEDGAELLEISIKGSPEE